MTDDPSTLEPRYRVPATVSAEARRELAFVYSLFAQRPTEIEPRSIAEWDRRKQRLEDYLGPIGLQFASKNGVSLGADRIGDVPVVRLRPDSPRPGGRTLVYLHGGGYVVLSARSALILPTLIAAATGETVISVDYTLAPRSNWRQTTGEVMSVWRALLGSGIPPASIGLVGDSAGGGLAAGSVLRMRDEGLPLPGALYLLSPWSDLTPVGDSCQTLAAYDPSLKLDSLGWGAGVYAAPAEQKTPYVSPVYGDYSKPFPPTLIQGGTREMFLSDLVRLYQAVSGGGHDAILDLYEGMPHVFQSLTPNSPETRTSIARASRFLLSRLAAADRDIR